MFSSNGSQVSGPVTYVEDVFSTYLYTGNSPSTNIITNEIDLLGEGGLVWCRQRAGGGNNSVWDTARGVKNLLIPNSTAADLNIPVVYPAYPDYGLQSFNSNGFTLGKNWEGENNGSADMVSWTFRKQPKFFDIVTYTGDGINNRAISHNLGSTPGCIMFKATSATSDWIVYHRSLTQDFAADNIDRLRLNSSAGQAGVNAVVNDVSSTTFTLGNNSASGAPNDNGTTYVAYLFAHDAGGFGLTGTDNVISCGTFTADGSGGCSVTLGYEPQWIMYKNTAADGWRMGDVMRGWNQSQWRYLTPNDSSSEGSLDNSPSYLAPTSTGFNSPTPGLFTAGNTFVYIAIRRGPMKVPTVGTSVFAPVLQSNVNTTPRTITGAGFAPDLTWQAYYQYPNGSNFFDRVRGRRIISPHNVSTEAGEGSGPEFTMDGIRYTAADSLNNNGNAINWFFKRAAGFFDTVCYTGNSASSGTGNTQLISHNLTVPPEMIIIFRRGPSGADRVVWHSALSATQYMFLDGGAVLSANPTYFFGTTGPTPSKTQFKVGDAYYTNNSGDTYLSYLFATCPGVSKVGSYTGNGTSLTIDCGFTGGARWILIKRTSASGDWYVWDTTRGIIAGNDPHFSINSAAIHITTDDSIDTDNSGFIVNQLSATDINVTSATYIFLAIA